MAFKTSHRQDPLPAFKYAAYGFVAFALTILFLNLVANYWAYYDIGINASANSFTLVFFVAPIVFTLLLAAAFSTDYVVRHRGIDGWKRLVCVIVSMMIFLSLLFLFQAWLSSDYPSLKERNMPEFIRFYLGKAKKTIP